MNYYSAEICPICTDPLSFAQDGESIVSLKCGHLLHKSCIEEYIRKVNSASCPICRGPIEVTAEAENQARLLLRIGDRGRSQVSESQARQRAELKRRLDLHRSRLQRRQLTELPNVQSKNLVFAGESHTVLISPDGDVWTFGLGKNGRLGHGDETEKHNPTKIDG